MIASINSYKQTDRKQLSKFYQDQALNGHIKTPVIVVISRDRGPKRPFSLNSFL